MATEWIGDLASYIKSSACLIDGTSLFPPPETGNRIWPTLVDTEGMHIRTIPHSKHSYVAKSAPGGVLHVVTLLTEYPDGVAKQVMLAGAAKYVKLNGLDGYVIHWAPAMSALGDF